MYWGEFINNPARKELGIKPFAYMVYGMIDKLSANEAGLCNMSRAKMACEIGVSKQTIITIVEKGITMGLITKNSDGKLRTTSTWKLTILRHDAAKKAFFEAKNSPEVGKETVPIGLEISKESLPLGGKETIPTNEKSVKKLDRIGKESLPHSGKETLPNTIIVDTINYKNKKEESTHTNFESESKEKTSSELKSKNEIQEVTGRVDVETLTWEQYEEEAKNHIVKTLRFTPRSLQDRWRKDYAKALSLANTTGYDEMEGYADWYLATKCSKLEGKDLYDEVTGTADRVFRFGFENSRLKTIRADKNPKPQFAMQASYPYKYVS